MVVRNIYMVISSLSVYLLENSVKILFKFFLFHGVGLLVSYPPKKIRENRTTDEEVTHVLRHWSRIYARFALISSIVKSTFGKPASAEAACRSNSP